MVLNERQIQKNISRNIKKFRKKKNITQKQLAKLVDVAPSTASSWEQEASNPNIDTLVKICKILEVDINEMFGIEAIDPELNLSQIEKKIILGYRKADEVDKKIIERTAGIRKNETLKNIG